MNITQKGQVYLLVDLVMIYYVDRDQIYKAFINSPLSDRFYHFLTTPKGFYV